MRFIILKISELNESELKYSKFRTNGAIKLIFLYIKDLISSYKIQK